MPTAEDIINLPEPSAAPAKPADPGPMVIEGQDFGGMEAIAKRIEEIKSPIGQEFYRSAVEGMMSKTLGFRVTIPNTEELEYRKEMIAHQRKELRRQDSEAAVSEATANYLNLSPAARKQMGVDESTPLQDPQKFLGIVNSMQLAPYGRQLQLGDLFSAGWKLEVLDPKQRAIEQAKLDQKASDQKVANYKEEKLLERQALSDKVAQAEAPGQIAKGEVATGKLAEEMAQGKGVWGEQLSEAQAAVEKSYGVDLTSSMLGPDVDIDEQNGKGGAALNDLILGQLQKVGVDGGIGVPVAAAALNKRYGPMVMDELKKFPVDEKGQAIVGKGASGLDAGATFGLATYALIMSKAEGKPAGQFLKENGLSQSGINVPSFLAAAEAYAQDNNIDPAKMMNDLGLEEFAPAFQLAGTQPGKK